ncbi:MAG TPA: fatty acid desaturase [Rhizomicrobium sp.]|nr:fatty acid desaturase [Rhizomicrobium sp.]
MNHRQIDAALLLAVGIIAVLIFGAAPLLFHVGWKGGIAFVALAALTAPLHYGLMHETMHGNLFDSEEGNRAAGRALGVTLGLPFETMRFGHLAHHGFNRHSYDRPEAMKPGQSWLSAAGLYYFMLLGGNDLLYAVMSLPIFLPESGVRWVIGKMGDHPDTQAMRNAALRTFTNKARVRAIRIDVIAEVALAALAIWLWGALWWVFAGSVLARWIVLSILDNAPHYAMPLDSGLNARNTAMPRPIRWLILNQNFHGIHHHTPQTHWRELPALFEGTDKSLDGNWAVALLRQFRGPQRLA